MFTHEGGIDIGNVEDKAKTLLVQVGEEDQTITADNITKTLLSGLDSSKHERVSKFIMVLYEVYRRQYFTYMEINPLVITDSSIYILDFAAKVRNNFRFSIDLQNDLLFDLNPTLHDTVESKVFLVSIEKSCYLGILTKYTFPSITQDKAK